MISYGSLFSGIGGFDLGFTRAGMECKWQVEIDGKCQDVLRRNLPGAEIHDDVRECGKHNLTPVDVICGGFPCQDLSIAGRREGLAGERSGLWFEFHRIIAELKPQWVVVENVPGLLSSNGGKDFAIILRGLVECGYGVCWRILDAQYFGVPQRRRRVFIVGSLGNGRAAEVLFEREGGIWNTAPSREAGQGVAHSISASPTATGRLDPNGQDFVTAYNIMPTNSTKDYKAIEAKYSQSLTTDGNHGANQGGTYIAFTIQQNDNGTHKRKDRPNGGLYVKEADSALTVGGTDQTVIAFDTTQITSKGNYSNPKPGDACHPLAEGVRPPAIAWQMNHASEAYRESGAISPTLQERMGTGGNNIPLVGVRRLTPVECERLQGFPDGWTDGQADSTRYRQLGNAVAVPVVEWIARRIMTQVLSQPDKWDYISKPAPLRGSAG